MQNIEAALQLFHLGFTPIPLWEKRPVVKNWQKRFEETPLTENDIVNGLKEIDDKVVTYSGNIGVVTGKISGVVVIDVDSDEALQRLKAYGELPRTWAVKTNRGWHFYYKYVPLPSCTPLHQVDFLSDKKQVVAPPSIHPNGHQYHWSIHPNEVELADLPSWFIELVKNKKQDSNKSNQGKSFCKKTSPTLYQNSPKNKTIDAILNSVDWLDFYSRFVTNISGEGEWKSSTCPFHEDEKNSFGFHTEHGGWTCFAGCGSGSGLHAIQKIHNVDFKKAIKLAKGENIYD